jgi:hypothetical protein
MMELKYKKKHIDNRASFITRGNQSEIFDNRKNRNAVMFYKLNDAESRQTYLKELAFTFVS